MDSVFDGGVSSRSASPRGRGEGRGPSRNR
jgi:hypothetical protein